MKPTRTTDILIHNLREHMNKILKRRGQRRMLAIETLFNQVRQFGTRKCLAIEQMKLECIELQASLAKIQVDSSLEENYKEKCVMLEQKVAHDKKWKARYLKNHQRLETEVSELKKRLGITDVPWYEQGENDSVKK